MKKNNDRVLITGVVLFDVYAGDRLPAGQKSLALEVTLQPRDRTLTDAEIEELLSSFDQSFPSRLRSSVCRQAPCSGRKPRIHDRSRAGAKPCSIPSVPVR